MLLVEHNTTGQRLFITSAHNSYEGCIKELVEAGNELMERQNAEKSI